MKEDYAAHYRRLHGRDKVFRGYSIHSAVSMIVECVNETQPRSLLDYGCGKGKQYEERQVHLAWGGLMPHLFDVGVEAFSARPKGPFDGVICTDVLEHIAEPDVDPVLADIFSFLPPRDDGGESFAVFWVSCRPARAKKLQDGRNVHLTVRPSAWWDERISKFQRPGLLIRTGYEDSDG